MELGLKISIRELRDFLDFDKLKLRIDKAEIVRIDKDLLEHDLESLADTMFGLMKIDRRFLKYKS